MCLKGAGSAADIGAKGVFGYKNRANGAREDGFFRRKTLFFCFFQKRGIRRGSGGVCYCGDGEGARCSMSFYCCLTQFSISCSSKGDVTDFYGSSPKIPSRPDIFYSIFHLASSYLAAITLQSTICQRAER